MVEVVKLVLELVGKVIQFFLELPYYVLVLSEAKLNLVEEIGACDEDFLVIFCQSDKTFYNPD